MYPLCGAGHSRECLHWAVVRLLLAGFGIFGSGGGREVDSIQRRAAMLLRARGEVQDLVCSREGRLGEHSRELCQLLSAAPDLSLGGRFSWALGQ